MNAPPGTTPPSSYSFWPQYRLADTGIGVRTPLAVVKKQTSQKTRSPIHNPPSLLLLLATIIDGSIKDAGSEVWQISPGRHLFKAFLLLSSCLVKSSSSGNHTSILNAGNYIC